MAENVYQKALRESADKMGSPDPQAAKPEKKKGSIWILGAWRDLILFVLTPVAIIPAFMLANRMGYGYEDLALAVLAFGALGHHLPGMMRAYGDRALFKRFRVRFIVAPIFLIVVCVAFTLTDLSGILLMVYLWGAWHGMAQIYGFVRIYDAKVGSFDVLTKRLDLWLCVSWIITGILWSPARVYFLLELYHVKCAAPLPSAEVVRGIQLAAAGITLLITIAFACNHVLLMRRGKSPSQIKLLLLGTSIAFWWYANFTFSNLIVGLALFEVFHDVQYLAIVWAFNRRRAEADPNCGSFTRFLFRRYKWLLAGIALTVYVGLVLLYGSLRFLEQSISGDTLRHALTGVLAASGLLHFYYDGFIWKVREKDTGDALGVKGNMESAMRSFQFPPWAVHGAKWGIFVIPLILLAALERGAKAENFQRLQGLAEVVPTNPQVHRELAMVHRENHNAAKAIHHYRLAIENGLEVAAAHHTLGELLASQGDRAGALAEYEQALEINDRAAPTMVNLGLMRDEDGDEAEAVRLYERAIEIDPTLATAMVNLGLIHYRHRRFDEALAEIERGLAIDDTLVNGHRVAGAILVRQKQPARAVEHFERALALEPGDVATLFEMGAALSASGDDARAEAAYRMLLNKVPTHAGAHYRLASLLERLTRHDEALEHYRAVINLRPDLVEAKDAVARLGG